MIFAHAEEFHTETTSAIEHAVTNPWALTLLTTLVIFIWWRATKRGRIGGTLAVLFIASIAGYKWAPIFSAVAITLGFAGSLIVTLASLHSSAKPPTD